MTTSCPGFLDQDGIWNNGFDCSSPRVCCGTETNRYCCIFSTSSTEETLQHTSTNFLSEKWLFLQICTIALFLAITILICVMIYQCLASIRRSRQQKQQRMSILQVPLPASSDCMQRSRFNSHRISTISSTPSDTKSRCTTDTSIILNTPLNIYPLGNNSRHSTSTSSSYYIFSNEFEQFYQ